MKVEWKLKREEFKEHNKQEGLKGLKDVRLEENQPCAEVKSVTKREVIFHKERK